MSPHTLTDDDKRELETILANNRKGRHDGNGGGISERKCWRLNVLADRGWGRRTIERELSIAPATVWRHRKEDCGHGDGGDGE